MKEVRRERAREVEVEGVEVEHEDAPPTPKDVVDRAGVDVDAPERWVIESPGGEARWAEVERILDGHGSAKKLPELVLSLGNAHRPKLAKRLEDAAKVASGDIVLQLADLCDVTLTDKVAAALAAKTPPTLAAMRAHLTIAGPLAISKVLGDETVGAALRSWHKGPATALLPQLGNVEEDLAMSASVLAWLIASTPKVQVAYAFLRSEAANEIGATLNTLDDAAVAWSWVDGVDAALAHSSAWQTKAFAAEAKGTAKARLDGFVVEMGPAAGESDVEHAERIADTSELEKALGGKTLDVQQILDAAAINGAGAAALIANPKQRKRILAVASPEEVLRLGTLIGLGPLDHIDWLLETPGVEPAHVALAYNTWDNPSEAFIDSRIRTRLRKKWGAKFRPIEIFGEMLDALLGVAMYHPDEAEWLFERAEPDEILYAVARIPENTTTYCKTLEKTKIGYGWVRRLGAGPSDPYLRVLATNCPDEDTAKFVRERLLGDFAGWFKEDDTVGDTTAGSYDSPKNRLSIGMYEARVEPEGKVAKDLDTRVSELGAADIEALRSEQGRLRQVLERAPDADRPRIIYDVAPTLARFVEETPDHSQLHLAPYLRTRQESEHVEALSDKTVAAGLKQRFPRNPLALFPVLHQPAKLAKVLGDNAEIVTWIMTDAAAGPALHALGHRDVVEAAAEAMSEQPAAVKRIPSGELLDADARRAVEGLRDHAPDDKLTRTLSERLDEVPGGSVDDNAEAAEKAEHKVLWKSLVKLLDDKAPVASLLTVCEQRAHEAGKLFKDPEHDGLVARLASATMLSPLYVFPNMPWDGLLHAKSSREWLLSSEPAWFILSGLMPGELAVSKLAKLMDDFDGTAVNFLSTLPSPSGLKDGETRGLRLLFDASKSYFTQSRLFYLRWGALVDERYNQAEMARLWTMMERLPSAHVEQFAVKDFVSDPVKSNVMGLYGDQHITLYDKLLDEPDQYLYGQDEGVPRAQFQKIHGMSDEAFEAKVGKSIEQLGSDGAKLYRYKAVTIDAFSTVALHEIGHAVDDMMGNRTALAYDYGGWREFATAEFEEWAQMLGGWDKVPTSARTKIREAWQLFLNSSSSIDGLDSSVAAMCGPEHPIRNPAYKGVGVVDMALSGKTGHRDPFFANGRMWIINHHRKTFLSADESAMRASPSAYGRSAPAEFFAECYVDYYRNYDGKNPDKKGGRLASEIKTWFDDNVDNLKFNPARDKPDKPEAAT